MGSYKKIKMDVSANIKIKRIIGKLRRPLAMLMVVLVIWKGSPNKLLFVFSTPLVVIGLLIRAWAAGVLHKNETVTSTGPYGYVRNPLYLGSFLLGFGFCFLTGKLWIVVLCILLFVVIYGFTVYHEERELGEKFGDKYLEYKKNVPAFFPKFFRKSNEKDIGFSFNRAFKVNREYNAIIGALAIYLIMFWKL